MCDQTDPLGHGTHLPFTPGAHQVFAQQAVLAKLGLDAANRDIEPIGLPKVLFEGGHLPSELLRS